MYRYVVTAPGRAPEDLDHAMAEVAGRHGDRDKAAPGEIVGGLNA